MHTKHESTAHHDVRIAVHVTYESLQTPETAFQTTYNEPGKAVVHTYTDVQDQYSDSGSSCGSRKEGRIEGR